MQSPEADYFCLMFKYHSHTDILDSLITQWKTEYSAKAFMEVRYYSLQSGREGTEAGSGPLISAYGNCTINSTSLSASANCSLQHWLQYYLDY